MISDVDVPNEIGYSKIVNNFRMAMTGKSRQICNRQEIGALTESADRRNAVEVHPASCRLDQCKL